MAQHEVKLVLDSHEGTLLKLITALHKGEECTFLQSQTLDVGDICFVVDSKPVLLIERKEASDLLSSFIDKRFEEQRERMLLARRDTPQLILMFLIEGDYEEVVRRHNAMPERANDPRRQFDIGRIYSALKKLPANYGMHVHKTDSVLHTSEYLGFLLELYKASGALPHLESNASMYNVTKLPKKLNLSPRETYALSLACIPGVSKEMAMAIARKYPSYFALVDTYQKLKSPKARETLLAGIAYGKSRKLGPKTSARVYHMVWSAE